VARGDDKQAKDWLRNVWPQTSRIWSERANGKVWWLRAQPTNRGPRSPRLSAPGSRQFHTQPDGLWVSLGLPRLEGETDPRYIDCIVVEACGTIQNLNDKRSRYAARSSALMVDMQRSWLNEEIVVLGGRGGQ
jgi:hypothetical protein